ncbi:DUF6801 domain-containing protein [Streptomyces maoxianensis]|uniref:DUF6801 domain-containing protein n=1 Tax=Streptomyces maoxianensis TaxID=1459942 RepID=A0ABV9FW60_9ACTN
MVAAVVLSGSAGFFGAGSATADPAPRTFSYTCAFPLIGDEPMTASVVWTASHTHVVGQATPRSPVNTTATVGENVTGSLRLIGARTVEGTADVHAVVAAPEGDIPKTVTLEVPKTDIPESGPLIVRASGTLPSLTFHETGSAKIVIGDIDLHLTPRDSDGDETMVGEVNAPCDLNSGQDGVLATFTIRPAATGPTASGTPTAPGTPNGPGGTPGAGGSGTSGSGSGSGPGSVSGSPSGSASGSASASASTKVRDPSGRPSGTASASRSGAPSNASPAASETGGTDFAAPLRAVAAFLAVSAVALGCGWWGTRRRRTRDRDG